jgi:hypothetical protein
MKLAPLFTDQRLPNVTDNACGAVSRMILKHPNAVPLDQVLPVLLRALPLKKDFVENKPVFDCIYSLFKSNNPVLGQHVAMLFPVFVHMLSLGADSDEMKPETHAQISEMVKAMSNDVAFQSFVGQLGADQRTALMQ